MKNTLLILGTIAINLLFATAALADPMEVPTVGVTFEGDIPKGLKRTVGKVSAEKVATEQFKLVSPKETKSRATKAGATVCSNSGCLNALGKVFASSMGFAVKVKGDAQIYDYTVTFFHLQKGSVLAEKKGTCEICSTEELVVAYEKTLSELVSATTPPPYSPEATSVTVNLVVAPPEAKIAQGDTQHGQGKANLELLPGEHTFTVSADGYETLTVPVRINEDSQGPISLDVQLTPSAVAEAPHPSASDDRSTWGWTLGVGGGVVAMTGIYVLSLDGEATCESGPAHECPDVYNTTTPGVLLLGMGSAAATAGIMFLAWEPIGEWLGVGNVQVAPTANGGAQMSFGGEF